MARTTPLARLVLTLFFLGVSASAFAQLPGAIFTTDGTGSRVNANIFQEKCGADGVWLDGGPGPHAPAGAAGLPQGDYYFQVTDPSGKTLLSTDPVINRKFHVGIKGFITNVVGSSHVTAADHDHGAEGAIIVELCDFNDTPNPGGVYKAWVTPVGDFVGNPNLVDNPCRGGCFHGFVASASKTDNFKVRAGQGGACLEMLKLIDTNGNGASDNGEQLVNWPMTIVDPLGTTNTFWTPTNKECTFNQLVPGAYTITEGTHPSFVVTGNAIDGKFLRDADETVLIRIKNNATREVGFLNAPK